MPAMPYARVAEKYDAYVTTAFDVPFFLEEALKAEGPALELMAGTGRVSLPLIEAGVDLTCVDSSPEMLAILQRKLARTGFTADCVVQDVSELHLSRHFALIFIPFHSFAELLTVAEQQRTLARIAEHLAPSGRFICTLQNPPVRLRNEDGRLRLYGRFPLASGTLLLWGVSQHSLDNPLVTGVQLYEEYDEIGVMREKSFVDVQFRMVTRDEFASLAEQAGFIVCSVYGDYSRAPFVPETSPFMIWELQR